MVGKQTFADSWYLKLDAAGNLIWAKEINIGEYTGAMQMASGNVLLYGFSSNGNAKYDLLFRVIDSTGGAGSAVAVTGAVSAWGVADTVCLTPASTWGAVP